MRTDEDNKEGIGLRDLSVRLVTYVSQQMIEAVKKPMDPTPEEYMTVVRSVEEQILDWLRGLKAAVESEKQP